MSVTSREFRDALGRFASGVTVVTTMTEFGRPWGMTVSAFSSVSLEPPLVLICIDKGASGHAHLVTGSAFAVNILDQGQEAISRRFASRDVDRFDGTTFRQGVSGSPLIDGTIARIECRVVNAFPAGDHTIVVGEVIALEVADGKPLVYFRGGYNELG